MDHKYSNVKIKKMKEFSGKADFAMFVGPVTDERPARRIFSLLVIVPANFTINISSHFYAFIILSRLCCKFDTSNNNNIHIDNNNINIDIKKIFNYSNIKTTITP